MKLHAVTSIGLLSAFAMIFFYAPIEANQGVVQKIFYIHVASAITMYVGFFISFLAGIFYLVERKLHWDEFSVSGAEVGFFFTTVVLLTGPIWAKPIWGVWWDWEPRLTTTFLLWLLYAAYLTLRGYFGSTQQGRIVTSILAIIAFLDVPLIHVSVRLWRGIHPSVLQNKDGLPSSMQITLAVTFLATLLLFCSLFWIRLQLEKTKNQYDQLRLQLSEGT